MKLRFVLTAALLACLAASVAAQTADTEPLKFLFTKEEAASFAGAADKQAFLNLFWARRDPTPGTPANEYRAEVEARIEYADANFKGEKVRGALTDRGKALIVYGQPKRAAKFDPPPPRAGTFDASDSAPEASVTWTYEGDDAKAIFGVAPAPLKFVNRMARGEYKLERARIDFAKAQERAIARSITNPNATATAVAATPAAAAPAAAAPAAAAAPLTALTTDAFRTAVAEVKAASKNPYDGKSLAAWGEYVTTSGQYFVPVGLYVPKAAGITGDVTFFGVVEDASGKSVLAFEQPRTLSPVKDDFFVDTSLALPAGKHRGYFGLAQNGKVVALTPADMELAGSLDKDAVTMGPLILAREVFPLEKAQRPDDPFAFGGLKVVPKPDRTYRTDEELLYFAELRNPGVGDATPSADGSAPAAAEPRLQVKVDVEGTDTTGKKIRKSAPLAEMKAMELKGMPGRWAIGTGIPLSSFAPGDYTFTIKVIDTVKKTSHTKTEKFKVVP